MLSTFILPIKKLQKNANYVDFFHITCYDLINCEFYAGSCGNTEY